MRVLALVLLTAAASCARTARPSRPPAPVAAPVGTPAAPAAARTVATADLLASLGLTGGSWEAALAQVPPERARAVAIALLREGNLACRDVIELEAGCGMTEEEFAPLPADATLGDSCLRRQVAHWALSQLEATDIPAVADALAGIVTLPLPERQLTDDVAELMIPADDGLRLRLIAAAAAADRPDVADALLAGISPGAAGHALVELGREAALPYLGATPALGTLAAALERGVSQPTAMAILDAITADDLAETTLADQVRQLAAGADCELAANAAMLLEASGDPQYLPARAALTDAAAATRALCVASHVSALEARAVLETLLSRDGLDLISVERGYWDADADADPDLDGDGDPHTRTTREHVTRADLDADALLEWLPSSCDGTTCASPAGTVTLGFNRGARGGLALDEIRLEPDGNDCGC